MRTLPAAIVPILAPFATLFTNPTWQQAQLLLVGAILATGQRTVAAALRVMGRSDQDDFARYHEVLNRAVWSPREAARILLLLLLRHPDHGDGPLVFGIDETLHKAQNETRKPQGDLRGGIICQIRQDECHGGGPKEHDQHRHDRVQRHYSARQETVNPMEKTHAAYLQRRRDM